MLLAPYFYGLRNPLGRSRLTFKSIGRLRNSQEFQLIVRSRLTSYESAGLDFKLLSSIAGIESVPLGSNEQ